MHCNVKAIKDRRRMPSEPYCMKHPYHTSGGICAFCLRDRLLKLVCPDCGESRLSSCTCSDTSLNPSSSSVIDVGTIGRIAFLIENDCSESKLEPSDLLSRINTDLSDRRNSSSSRWNLDNFSIKKKGSSINFLSARNSCASERKRQNACSPRCKFDDFDVESRKRNDNRSWFIDLNRDLNGRLDDKFVVYPEVDISKEDESGFIDLRMRFLLDSEAVFSKNGINDPSLCDPSPTSEYFGYSPKSGGVYTIPMDDSSSKSKRMRSKVWKWMCRVSNVSLKRNQEVTNP